MLHQGLKDQKCLQKRSHSLPCEAQGVPNQKRFWLQLKN